MDEYDKLNALKDELYDFSCATFNIADFIEWKNKTERFLIKNYGAESCEVDKLRSFSFYKDCPDRMYHKKQCKYWDEFSEFISYMGLCLEEMQEQLQDNSIIKNIVADRDYSKVFIVHGHDGELKEAVARIIEKQGIKAVILSEQVNRFAAIIEKIEKNSDVSGAVCLFTSDDFGRAKGESADKPRARQNVIFETGYFVGKLGRENIVLINDGKVEMPSDLQGIAYTHTNEWKLKLLQELKAIGYNIDYNKIDE